jgi:hypothetical protein
MPKIGLINMLIGFCTLFIAASAGAFISFDLTQAFLKDPALLHVWEITLMKSAHGHTNLFGILHITLGLTLPYSPWPEKWKVAQTIGLFAGVIAMGPLMMIRAYLGPTDSFEPVGLFIGACLSLALLAIASHAAGLAFKIMKRT